MQFTIAGSPTSSFAIANPIAARIEDEAFRQKLSASFRIDLDMDCQVDMCSSPVCVLHQLSMWSPWNNFWAKQNNLSAAGYLFLHKQNNLSAARCVQRYVQSLDDINVVSQCGVLWLALAIYFFEVSLLILFKWSSEIKWTQRMQLYACRTNVLLNSSAEQHMYRRSLVVAEPSERNFKIVCIVLRWIPVRAIACPASRLRPNHSSHSQHPAQSNSVWYCLPANLKAMLSS